MSVLFQSFILAAAIFLPGTKCDTNDLCLARTTNCPAGKLCYGDCPPNMMCTVDSGDENCGGCAVGWIGFECDEDANECKFFGSDPCKNDGDCVNTIGSYKCICKTGWTGDDCTCKQGTACDPTADASQISPSSFGSLMVLSVSIVWSRIGASLE